MEEINLQILKIDTLKEEIRNFEVNPDDYTDQYDEMLDMCYEQFMGSYSVSYTLKCVDETAYRCGLLDYVDSLDVSYPTEWDDDLSDLLQELDCMIDDEVEWYRDLLDDLEQDLENGENVQLDMDNALARIEELENIRKEYL